MHWIFPILIFLLVSCKQEKDMKLKEYNIPTEIIPYRIQEYGETSLKKEIRRLLNFSKKAIDENTITIRIWNELDNHFTDIYVLSFNEKHNSVIKYKLRHISTDGMSCDSASYSKFDLGEPKVGWKNFTNKVLQFDIINIPDFTSLPSYFENTDEQYVSLEFIKFNFYSFAEYPGPRQREDKFYYAKKTADLVDYIKSNF